MATHAHHHGSVFHRLFHYADELFNIGVEIFLDILAPTKYKEHHGYKWYLVWGSGIAAALIFWYGGFSFSVAALAPHLKQAKHLIYILLPFWLPLLLGKIWIEIWLKYIRLDFIRRNEGVLLEIRIPKEIEKTPKAMELFFMAMYETGSVEYNDTYWDGKIRPWFSYEFASFGGEIHFYIWTLPKYRNVLEAQVYAQYPTVEIVEAEDYAKKKVFNPPQNFMWGTHFVLSRPDVYPIMTYVDYGLDKETEEEYKVDPLSTLLEYLGSIKKGEEIWIQVLAQAYRPFKLVEGKLFKDRDWVEEGKREVNKIMRRHPETKSTRQFTEIGYPIVPTLSEWEKKQAEAIERSINKRAFRCMIRSCYHAEPEAFEYRSPTVSGLLGTIRKPFNSNLLNGFSLGWYTDIADMTKDLLFPFGLKNWAMSIFIPKYAKMMLDAYRRRSFFYAPFRNWRARPFILTTEELATIYHFPGKVVTTPSFERIPSKKVQPPSNLPI